MTEIFSIVDYNNKVNVYETSYKQYIDHIFEGNQEGANTTKIQLNSVNSELISMVTNLSQIINQKKANIETLESTLESITSEYNDKKKILDNKYSDENSILQREVKNDRKIKNINDKLNRKNNMIIILIIIDCVIGLFLAALITFVIILKFRLKKVFSTKISNNKKTVSNNKNKNKNNSNRNSNSNSNKSNNSNSNSNNSGAISNL